MVTVAFLINGLAKGGAERVVSWLASCFADSNKYKAIIITSKKTDDDYKVSSRVERFVVSANKKNRLAKNIYEIRKIRKILKTKNVDFLIGFMAESNFRAILSSLFLKTKVIISVRSDPKREYPNLIYNIAANALFPLSKKIVFQTETALHSFRKKLQKKSVVIPNPIDKTFLEYKYSINNKNGIVTLGRFNKSKRHDLLIRAYSKICNKVEDDLYIYGSGSLLNEYKLLIKNLNLNGRIHLCGFSNDVLETLSNKKVFVLCSDYEGMPNALMEALSVGVPSISTDCQCGGPKSLICNGTDGFLINVGDIDLLSQRMLELCNNKNLRSKFSSYSKKKMKKYEKNKVFKLWEALIDE